MSLNGPDIFKPHFLRALPVYLANFLLLLMSTQTINFVAIENVHVIVFLIPVFYWTIHSPTLLPLWFVFLGGLAIDFTVDSLLGLHAFVFIIYTIILYRMRRIIVSQPIIYHFVIFALSVFIFELIRWMLLSVITWQMTVIFPSILGIVLNIILFFPIMLVLRFLHRIVSGNGKKRSF